MEKKGLIKDEPNSSQAVEEVIGSSRPVQRALARSAIYRLLSTAIAYPTSERLAALREELFPLGIAGADLLSSGLRQRVERLASSLHTSSDEEIQDQYHYCIGHVSMGDCPSYETAPIDANVFQQSQVMADVAGFYKAFGFALSEKNPERGDHVTVELEFMRALSYKEAYARVFDGREKVDICRRGERRFWREHLGYWLPGFARALGAKAQSGYYAELAALLEKFARVEDRGLGAPIRLAQAVPQQIPEHIPLMDLNEMSEDDDEGWEMPGGDAEW